MNIENIKAGDILISKNSPKDNSLIVLNVRSYEKDGGIFVDIQRSCGLKIRNRYLSNIYLKHYFTLKKKNELEFNVLDYI